jgi:ADP-ribosylglycohydrolase
MRIPDDYAQRVYAGVLGKIIGVYLGRPFEAWWHQRIIQELGEINYYVNERLNLPLVVTDDDISGAFTFIRSLEDYANGRELTAQQIGSTWLNYLIENRTILWWGGMGTSTSHTAYLRLKRGVPVPRSGSIELNGKIVAEQIGAQIFIDGWGMVCPGQPALAAEFAQKAATVSQDGEAIYGSQVIASIEALAFVERDLNKLLDTAVSFIPKDSVIAKMIADLRKLRQTDADWRGAYQFLKEHYGYS